VTCACVRASWGFSKKLTLTCPPLVPVPSPETKGPPFCLSSSIPVGLEGLIPLTNQDRGPCLYQCNSLSLCACKRCDRTGPPILRASDSQRAAARIPRSGKLLNTHLLKHVTVNRLKHGSWMSLHVCPVLLRPTKSVVREACL
jgi:hypothetical protein